MRAVGRIFVNGSPAGTGFLAGPSGVALTAAHVVATTNDPPFRQVAGPVQLELSGERVDAATVEIPNENLDIAVLVLATDPGDEPLLCGPAPTGATVHHADFRLAGYPSGARMQRSVFTGKLVGRDEAERLELSPGPPQGMSGGPIIVADCVVGVQSVGASAVAVTTKDAATSGFQWGHAAALDQLPDEVIARLNWRRITPEDIVPFGNRTDAVVPSEDTRRMPPVLQIVLSHGTEPGTLSIRRTRWVWGVHAELPDRKLAFRKEDFGRTLQKVLRKLASEWTSRKRAPFSWAKQVCLVSLPEDSEEYPPFEESPILTTVCGHKFLCLALSSSDHSGNFTPDVVRLSPEAANAFEFDDSDVVALATLRANRQVAFLGSVTATAAATRWIFDACDELALIIVQRSGTLSDLRSKLFGNSDEVELPTLLRRITEARAEGHKLLVMWNDGEFMIEEEEYFTSIGE